MIFVRRLPRLCHVGDVLSTVFSVLEGGLSRRSTSGNSDNGHYVRRNNSVLNHTRISQIFSFFF
jgi:hypothetical protein